MSTTDLRGVIPFQQQLHALKAARGASPPCILVKFRKFPSEIREFRKWNRSDTDPTRILEFRWEIFEISREYTGAMRPLPLLTHANAAKTEFPPVDLWSTDFAVSGLQIADLWSTGFKSFSASALLQLYEVMSGRAVVQQRASRFASFLADNRLANGSR